MVGEQPENMLGAMFKGLGGGAGKKSRGGVFMSDWMVSGKVVGDDGLSSEACKPCVFKTLVFSSAKASQNAL